MKTETTTESAPKAKSPYFLLIIVMMGLFLAIINQTLLNVAIPHLMNEFGVSTSTIQWLSTGYMLVNGVLIPLSAFLIARFGIRSLFLTSMIFFTLGALICGLASSFPIMLTGRLVQAVGGGILSPLVMAIILQIFPPESRGKGMGILGLAMMFAPAVGPTLSGWVMQNHSWRVMFYAMVPLGLIIMTFAIFRLHNTTAPKKMKLDLFGTISSLIGFSTLLYGVSEAGSKGWDDPIVLATIVIGILSLTAFVIQQLRSDRPMLDFRVFKYDMFSLSNIISILITVVMYTGMFLLPIYLQNLRGFSTLDSGLLLLPGSLVMMAMSPISGILFDKVGPRPLAIVGLFITAVTTYQFTQLTADTTYGHIMVVNMIRSLGISLLMMPIMTAGLNQLPERLNNHGNAMSNTLRQVSGSIGTSLITTIYTNRTTFHYATMTDQMNSTDSAFMNSFQSFVQSIAASMHTTVTQAQTYAMSILTGQASLQSTIMGIGDAFYWAVGFAVAGIVLSCFLRDVRKDREKEKEEEKQEIHLLPAPK